jgi:UDP-glucose 4-epimerase
VKILVTGATGFIGSHLLPGLASRHHVVAVTRGASLADAPPTVEWVRQDLATGLDRALLPDNVDGVVHLAQSKRYKQLPEGAGDVFAVNVESTFRLLEYARAAGARKFVLASTGGVYEPSDRELSETDRLKPNNFYFGSKCSAEALVASYRSFFDSIILRFFFVYGPGQREMLVQSLIERVMTGAPIVVESDPGRRINPIYVGDATAVFEPALEFGQSDIFNVAGDESVTISELIALMERVTGKRAAVEHAPKPPPGDLVGDNARMKELLRVRPRTSLAEGLRAMVSAHFAPARSSNARAS